VTGTTLELRACASEARTKVRDFVYGNAGPSLAVTRSRRPDHKQGRFQRELGTLQISVEAIPIRDRRSGKLKKLKSDFVPFRKGSVGRSKGCGVTKIARSIPSLPIAGWQMQRSGYIRPIFTLQTARALERAAANLLSRCRRQSKIASS